MAAALPQSADQRMGDEKDDSSSLCSSERSPGRSGSDRYSDSIRLEIQQLRGHLFDISDTDCSVALILDKVQQLTEIENRVVREQRDEIDRLTRELDDLRSQRPRGFATAVVATGGDEDEDESRIDGLESVPSFGSITMASSSSSSGAGNDDPSSSGYTNDSERPTSYSIQANQQLAVRANLSQSIASATAELRELNGARDEATSTLRHLEDKIQSTSEELVELENSKERILHEIDELRKQVQALLHERTKLIQEVEVYGHQSELVDELEAAHETNDRLRSEVEALRSAVAQASDRVETEVKLALEARDRAEAERGLAEERATREVMVRREMQSEMQTLYEEKIACEKRLDDLRAEMTMSSSGCGSDGEAKNSGAAVATTTTAATSDITRLKHEIQALRGENASLRSTAKRDSEVIAGLNDEIRSLISGSVVHGQIAAAPMSPLPLPHHASITAESARKKKRALSLGEDWDHKRSINYEPQRERFNSTGSGSLEMIDGTIVTTASGSNRERLDTGGSGGSVASHEADNVSLLFGQGSVDGRSTKSSGENKSTANGNEEKDAQSDHEGIRAHAEKLLYWANRATDRSRSGSSSVASRQSHQQQGISVMMTPANTPAKGVPKTIGLPPRSQSRVRKASSQLPPRCPPTPPLATTAAVAASSFGGATTDGNSTILSDKENGGTSFNRDVPGAFPRLLPKQKQQQRTKKNVSMAENDTIIDNLHYMQEPDSVALGGEESPVLCCECSASPFSGNDPQSEFYLPKLGLACNCSGGSLAKDRASFSKDPTSLRNILRPWQCDFLSTFGVAEAEELLHAHKADANGMARKMKKWRAAQGMVPCRSKECYVALKIWSRTCKVVLRSIREQRELAKRRKADGGINVDGSANGKESDVSNDDEAVVEKPQFLDISFADTHTIASISTLGQFSSVGGGGRPFEMMEI